MDLRPEKKSVKLRLEKNWNTNSIKNNKMLEMMRIRKEKPFLLHLLQTLHQILMLAP